MSTPTTGPRTPEEAVAIASTRFGWTLPDGSPGPLIAREFGAGFAVYAEKPAQRDLTVPPSGGGCVVVDKSDGTMTTWPALPVETIAEMYAQRRPGTR